MNMDMVCRQSTITARDILREMLSNKEVTPSIEAAKAIAEEYRMKGGYIKPELILDVWREMGHQLEGQISMDELLEEMRIE